MKICGENDWTNLLPVEQIQTYHKNKYKYHVKIDGVHFLIEQRNNQKLIKLGVDDILGTSDGIGQCLLRLQ